MSAVAQQVDEAREDGEASLGVDPRLDIVDWDGPNDPEHPQNWSTSRKVTCAVVLAFISTLSPFASSIISPGISYIKADLDITNDYAGAFVVSGFLIGYCCGPLIIAPLSELFGRSILYNVCSVMFLAFNIACAVAPSAGSLIVFRIFAGIGGSCPLTLGAASLADFVPSERRGASMTIWTLGPMVGPTIGPIVGGYLTQAKGWRWDFWVLAIASGVTAIVTILALPESYSYTILERRTRRLRKETGNPNLRSALMARGTTKELFLLSIFRPVKLMFLSPIVLLLSVYMAVLYGYLYLLFTTFPQVFRGQYDFSTGSIGLSYIGIGVGSVLGLFSSGAVSDRLVVGLKVRNGGESKPEYRLPPMAVGACLVPIGLFWYGWTAEKQLHWILPILGTTILGGGMVIVLMSISTYLVDAFTIYAASAMAANTVTRSLVGAFLPLAGNSLYQTLGLGWGNSLLGFIAFSMIPIPFVFYIYGERIRHSNLFKVEF
ncbi:fluconazole resistance protein [Truncatella angustata]|uniref:Fluconazole resistance protein n=1 Tax=Truncatella angustata TaxID=152316 RepID=A0A9P8ZVX8_9PEZI|nr:fluconazole resistance protein [Truncatella angustata]KAH6651542.1 fluconazole resistance protein [Truncatella angustata]